MKREFPSMATASAITDDDLTLELMSVLGSELDRQAAAGAARVDVRALAAAVLKVIGSSDGHAATLSEGKHPDELNATNDD